MKVLVGTIALLLIIIPFNLAIILSPKPVENLSLRPKNQVVVVEQQPNSSVSPVVVHSTQKTSITLGYYNNSCFFNQGLVTANDLLQTQGLFDLNNCRADLRPSVSTNSAKISIAQNSQIFQEIVIENKTNFSNSNEYGVPLRVPGFSSAAIMSLFFDLSLILLISLSIFTLGNAFLKRSSVLINSRRFISVFVLRC